MAWLLAQQAYIFQVYSMAPNKRINSLTLFARTPTHWLRHCVPNYSQQASGR